MVLQSRIRESNPNIKSLELSQKYGIQGSFLLVFVRFFTTDFMRFTTYSCIKVSSKVSSVLRYGNIARLSLGVKKNTVSNSLLLCVFCVHRVPVCPFHYPIGAVACCLHDVYICHSIGMGIRYIEVP